jgi:hypothetical protein
MTRLICSRNIERFQRLLDNETSVERRATLEKLLADEETIWSVFYADEVNKRDTSVVRPSPS